MCSINVCGLNNKLNYNILQEYIKNMDKIYLTETKCNTIEENELDGFKTFVMPTK